MLSASFFILGLIFGSFVNALVWRIRQQEISEQKTENKKQKKESSNLSTLHSNLSVISGRSQCVYCGQRLVAKDLVPIFSWLYLRGRCRYCGGFISVQYPTVELVCAFVFVLSYTLWPSDLAGSEWLLLATWLVSSVGLLALAIFDLKWMLLPNRILYPAFFTAAAGKLGYIVFFAPDKAEDIRLWILSVSVAAGIFCVIYYVSKGGWIGFGDVRLGLVTGTLLGTPSKSFLMIFLASVLGTISVLPALLFRRQRLSAKVPFGPFLIAATAATILFGQPLLDWYERLLI